MTLSIHKLGVFFQTITQGSEIELNQIKRIVSEKKTVACKTNLLIS